MLQCVQSCTVDRGHVPQAQDHHFGECVDIAFQVRQLVGRTKEERTVNSIDRDVVGNVVQLKAVGSPVGDVLRRHQRHGGGRRHTADIEKRGQDHARLDRDGEVGQHGEGERNQPYGRFGRTQLQHFRNLAPFAHVVGHDHQDAGKNRQRDVASQGSGEQQD